MTQWNLTIPDKTDEIVRNYLAQNGGDQKNLSQFVNEAVCQTVFRNTVKEIKEKNADRDQEELMNLVDEAVDWARENCS